MEPRIRRWTYENITHRRAARFGRLPVVIGAIFRVQKDPKEFSNPTKAYITLDEGTGNNKNAVSILHTRKATSFMVPDFTSDAQAQELRLSTDRVENNKVGKRLSFPGLSKALIQEQGAEAFFVQLLATAKGEAKTRQNKRSSAQRHTLQHD